MVEPGEVMIALGAFTAAAISIKVIASAVLRYEEIKLKHANPTLSGLAGATDARLERMEQAVDAIAVEIERISEGQRFTTKLLSERSTSVR
jgi:hypothetical protein